jgi:hypothetical protein
MKKLLIMAILFLMSESSLAFGQSNSMTFSFTIAGHDTATSAGVYDSTGVLVRTLWSNVTYIPGTYTKTWDGMLGPEFGSVAATTGALYTIKILTNAVTYTYDGHIGTTSKSWYSPDRMEMFAYTNTSSAFKFAFAGGVGWIASYYAEGNWNYGYMMSGDPNAPHHISDYHVNQSIAFNDLATDGKRVYFMNNGAWYADAFVTAVDAISGQPAYFTNGTYLTGVNCPAFPTCGGNEANSVWDNYTINYIDHVAYSNTPQVTTASMTSGNRAITVASTSGISVGQAVTGTNIPTMTYVLQQMGTRLILSNAPAGTGTGINLTFSGSSAGMDYPTGIAVQRSGNILAVAHGAVSNNIKLFDKTSGSFLGTVTGITNPHQMAFSTEGLWVVAGGQLYLVTGVGSSNRVTQPLTGFSNVVGVATNGATNSLFVLDGGTKQQMEEYAVTTHSVMRTYGTLGGYNDCNPTINNARLMVDGTATTGLLSSTAGSGAWTPVPLSWIAVDDNDEVWIAEGPNLGRVLHISASNTYVNQVLLKRPNYHVGLSETLPTRVFMDSFEYSVNYKVPINQGDPDPNLGGNGSWSLVKNWAVCAEGAHGSTWYQVVPFGFSILNVEQLSNGNVYAQVETGGNQLRIYQLPNSGTNAMRDTGISQPTGSWKTLLRDGSLSYYAVTGASPTNTVTAYHAWLTGFDGNANPLWSSFTSLGAATTTRYNYPVYPGSGWGVFYTGTDATTSGYIPVFSSGVYNSSLTTGFPHLNAIKRGYTGYAWSVMPEVCLTAPDFHGSFPCNGGYGGHNGTGPVRVEGKNIFAAFDGQYALAGAQFYHYWEDGLMVGQFGNWQQYPANFQRPSLPGNAGNIGAVSTTTYGGDVYFYNSDESWAPLHRWHISNLSSVHEYGGSGVLQPGSKVRKLTLLF